MGCMRNPTIEVHRLISRFLARLNSIVSCLLQPTHRSVVVAAVVDLSRSKADLIAENALLRQQALLIVQPATLLRWHRKGFQLLGKLKSKAGQGRQQISDETVGLIRRM